MRLKVSIAWDPELTGVPSGYDVHDLEQVRHLLERCLEPLGGLPALVEEGSLVVIKVNAGFAGEPGVATTDPRVVEALIQLLREQVAPRNIVIAENAADQHMLEEIGIGSSTMECFKACGLEDVARRTGASLIALEEDIHSQVMVPLPRVMSHCHIPRTIREAGTLIYMPHLKNHLACQITLNLKLSQGVIPTPDKKRCHNRDLNHKLLDLYQVIRPDLCIVDGLWAMQGQGPTSSNPGDVITDMNLLAAGKNALAVDMVGAMLMGLGPAEVPVLALAREADLPGSRKEDLEILGDSLEECARAFKKPSLKVKGVFPNVAVHQGEACGGCLSHLRIYLDIIAERGILEHLERPLSVIVGRNCQPPVDSPGPVLVVGDCAREHARLGLFVEGCCPLSHIFLGLLDQISTVCAMDSFVCTGHTLPPPE